VGADDLSSEPTPGGEADSCAAQYVAVPPDARSARPLRQRLRELAAVCVRFGYRRLTVLLRREGWRVNAKRVYRLYGQEGLEVRTKPRKKLASRARVPLPLPVRPNERWSMDFVSARLADGRWFRTLTVLGLFTRESLALVADRSLTGVKVAAALSNVLRQRQAPKAITVDNGSEFVSRAIDAWAYAHDVRPHSALQDRTPAAVGAMWVNGSGIETEITGASVALPM
jgi:transposase InsO family protein